MSIIATAPVPAHCRIDAADTDQYPIGLPSPHLSVAGGRSAGCPRWCVEHTTMAPIVAGDQTIACHSTGARTIEAVVTDLGGRVTQTSEIFVEAASHDDGSPQGPTAPTIWLAIGGDTPMTAATARELAAALVALAEQIDGAR